MKGAFAHKLYWRVLKSNHSILSAFFIWLICLLTEMSCLMTKSAKWYVRPAKTRISLGIRPVWSESSLSAWRKLECLATHWAHSKDSDQTGWMPRLIWVFTGCTGHFAGFVMRWLKWSMLLRIWSPLVYYVCCYTCTIIYIKINKHK